ncbi:GNAT family N-acetyltransferase [Streptococcus cuniculipharyngis]|uniref:GNAT family N-acetyltransferase n=1 Tax=Streptococcus cuniculipharyngis TaxID=1562651 RepID=A0A5C5S9N6_9STRE|nr:GNAT family N-acetyltransferase [Streptococcus cuniculipharyngis]TWS96690.1 GNAT family N-acetyltransferase [Streptococcus cuniculipharyngis]
MAEVEVIFAEAQPSDASALLALLNHIGYESDFMTLDEAGILMTLEQMTDFIRQRQESINQVCLLAKVADEVIGVLNVTSDFHERIKHIGDIFIGIRKDYWNQGIGQILMEEAIIWAEKSGVIRRLELTVQKRNQRAVHVYEKFGFVIEGVRPRGAKARDGQFLDVYMMGKMIN